MKVNLKRTWFGPTSSKLLVEGNKDFQFNTSGKRYRVRNNPHDFPESYRAILPKDAEILDKPPVEKPIEDPRVEKLGEHDVGPADTAPVVPPVVRRRQG